MRPSNVQTVPDECILLLKGLDRFPQEIIDGPPVLSTAAHSACPPQAAWQVVGVDLFLIGVGCTLGLEPFAASISMVACGLLLHHRAHIIMERSSCVALPNPFLLHGIAFVVLLFTCYDQVPAAKPPTSKAPPTAKTTHI